MCLKNRRVEAVKHKPISASAHQSGRSGKKIWVWKAISINPWTLEEE